MQSDTQPASTPTWMLWIGWIITVLPALGLLMSGGMKLAIVMKLMEFKPPEGSPDVGWPESTMLGLAIVEIGCTLLYLFPRTALLGAILLTGFLGGAVATHVRIGDPFFIQLMLGVLVWLGLFLRDERLRSILPWRGDSTVPAPGGFVAGFGKFVVIVAALVGVSAALIAAHPSEFRITRSITIDAPPAKVFEQVNDFHKWDAWSPWAKLDPNAKNSFEGPSSGTGAVFKWSSANDDVGEGSLTILESQPSERIKLKLRFTKPREDASDTEFTFKAKGEQTVVTWSVTGERDFVGKAMFIVLNVEKMIGGRFEEGLASMKKVVEAKKGDAK